MLSLSVVSPVKKILETDCKQITVPTQSGQITILPKHEPLFSLLSQGEAIVKSDHGDSQSILVSGGFVSVSKDKVTLLVDFGIKSDELDEKIILEAKDRAEKIVAESKSENITKRAQADLFHANLQLQFLYRRKNRHSTNTQRPH
jgi:F-type H+-transporting ATPase subunit epsilon